MSLAFSTLVIVLFGVLPGAVFELSVYSGKMARVRAPTPTLTDLAVAVGLSIPIHILVLEVASIGDLVDYPLFLRAIAGQFGENGQALDSLAWSFEAHRAQIAGYLLIVLTAGFVLGQVVQYILLLVPTADRLLPFRNEWFYRFFFAGGKRITACTAFVLTATSSDKSPLLYQGLVADFRVRLDGSLAELMLRESSRTELRPIQAHAEPGQETPSALTRASHCPLHGQVHAPQKTLSASSSHSWLPLPQDAFVVPGEEIVNLSLAYTRAWQPIWLISDQAVKVSKDSPSRIDLLATKSKPTRLLYTILKSRVRILVQPKGAGGDNLAAEVDLENPRHVSLRASGEVSGSISAHLFLVWSTDRDSRSGQTGNLLFWIHQKLTKFLAKKTETKIERAIAV